MLQESALVPEDLYAYKALSVHPIVLEEIMTCISWTGLQTSRLSPHGEAKVKWQLHCSADDLLAASKPLSFLPSLTPSKKTLWPCC